MNAAISACLMGICCRYDGGHRLDEKVLRLSEKGDIVPLCPEEMGGLPVPRPPAEIIGGDGDDVLCGKARILDIEGRDVTEHLLRGAEEFLKVVKQKGIKKAILKEKSPSCGIHKIYRNGVLVSGNGVLAALLKREGIEVISDEEVK